MIHFQGNHMRMRMRKRLVIACEVFVLGIATLLLLVSVLARYERTQLVEEQTRVALVEEQTRVALVEEQIRVEVVLFKAEHTRVEMGFCIPRKVSQ